jgi:hypothetical protein
MSFPISPYDGQLTTQNGIIYTYSTSTNSWRRNFNNVLDQLVIGGTYQSTATNNGALIVFGGAGIGKNLNVGGNLDVKGTVNAVGTVYLNPDGGDVFIEPSLNGTVIIYPNTEGNMDNVTIGENLPRPGYFTVLEALNTANSNSTSSGALVVSGGAGIGKDLYVGGTIFARNFAPVGTIWYYTSTNYTAVSGDRLLLDTALNTLTVYLPPSPTIGDIVEFIDFSGTFSNNNATFDRNGQKIMGVADNLILDLNYAANTLIYSGTIQGWKIGVIF